MLRTMLLAAAVIAPLAWAPAEATAQARGADRAAAATAEAEQAVATNGLADRLPPELAELFEGGLPPGLANLVVTETTAGESDGGQTSGEDCVRTPEIIGGRLLIKECDGTYTDPLTGETVTP
jgi:hypothetical protein